MVLQKNVTYSQNIKPWPMLCRSKLRQNYSFSTFLSLHIDFQCTPYCLGSGPIHTERGTNLILAVMSHLEDVLKYLPTYHVFHEYIQMGGSHQYLLETNYVGMLQRPVINNLWPHIFINIPPLLGIVFPPPSNNSIPIRLGSNCTQPVEKRSLHAILGEMGAIMVTQINENSTRQCGVDPLKIQPHQRDLDQCYHPRNSSKL